MAKLLDMRLVFALATAALVNAPTVPKKESGALLLKRTKGPLAKDRCVCTAAHDSFALSMLSLPIPILVLGSFGSPL
jgi:hypothetical protein